MREEKEEKEEKEERNGILNMKNPFGDYPCFSKTFATCCAEISKLAVCLHRDLDTSEAKPQVPKIIFQTFKSEEELPQHWKGTPDSWRKSHRDYKYIFYKDNDCRNVVAETFPWFLEIYDSFPEIIYRIDAFRAAAAFNHGGFYIDMDIQNKPGVNLDQLCQQNGNSQTPSPAFFLFLDPLGYLIDESDPGSSTDGRNRKICNCFFGAKPRSAFLLLLMWVFAERAYASSSLVKSRRWWCTQRETKILHTAGPGAWTEALRLYTQIGREGSSSSPSSSTSSSSSSFSRWPFRSSSPFSPPSALCDLIIAVYKKESPFLIPAMTLTPILSAIVPSRPLSYPCQGVILQEGLSWVPSKTKKSISRLVQQLTFWVEICKNHSFFNQLLRELDSVEAALKLKAKEQKTEEQEDQDQEKYVQTGLTWKQLSKLRTIVTLIKERYELKPQQRLAKIVERAMSADNCEYIVLYTVLGMVLLVLLGLALGLLLKHYAPANAEQKRKERIL